MEQYNVKYQSSITTIIVVPSNPIINSFQIQSVYFINLNKIIEPNCN